MYSEYLRKLKDERKKTNQQIADSSGVPLSTVHRIISGAADGANALTLVNIVRALEGSLDEMFGLKPPAVKSSDDTTIKVYEQMVKGKDEIIAEKSAEIHTKDKWIIRLATVIGLLLLFFVFMVVLDRLNGDIGYIRY